MNPVLWAEHDLDRCIILIGQIKSRLDVSQLKLIGNERFDLYASLNDRAHGFRYPHISLLPGVMNQAGIHKLQSVIMPAADV